MGTDQRMGKFLRIGLLPVAFVVVGWRALSELVERMGELSANGDLARRVEARRAGVLTDALVRAGVRAPARVPVLVGARVDVSGRVEVRALASVQVGGVGVSDVDDIGLLEGAMRRAASERMGVSATGVQREAERRVRRAASRGETELAAEVLATTPEHPRPERQKPERQAPERAKPVRTKPERRRRPDRAAAVAAAATAVEPHGSPVHAAAHVAAPMRPVRRESGWTDWRFLAGEQPHVESVERQLSWQLPAVLVGALLSFAPLMRPLTDAAPWLALAGLALVTAGWLGARRS